MRALIIEDDPSTVLILTVMLEEMGIEICGIEATEEGAVQAAANSSPDLMIVDINLHVGTGIGAVRKILTHGYIPHLFVSADLNQLRATNPDAIMLPKPYHYDQLSDAIHRATAKAI